jgi:hypothetical protein
MGSTQYYHSWQFINDPQGYSSTLYIQKSSTPSLTSPNWQTMVKIHSSGTISAPRYRDLQSNIYVLDLADTDISLYAPGAVKAKLFADESNDTYYLDPANTNTSLKVAGKIISNEIQVVDLDTRNINSEKIKVKNLNVEIRNVADYVFDEDYQLMNLKDVENFVQANKHLPAIPSASEMEENGMNVAEMNNLLLQKVEELTLYIIELEKRIDEIESSK